MNALDKCFDAVRTIINNLPDSWVTLTTHRLDIYDESQAKSQFLSHLQSLLESGDFSAKALESLPTAYDYIRLGHQLSSVLEWLLAEINGVHADQVITFTSKTMPIFAVMRQDALSDKVTHIYYDGESAPLSDKATIKDIYGYNPVLHKINSADEIASHDDGTVIFVTESAYKDKLNHGADVTVNIHPMYGSTIVIHKGDTARLVKDVQHVRRRESIAMTPPNTLNVLNEIVNGQTTEAESYTKEDEQKVHQSIAINTGSDIEPLVASSGLSIQYAMMMALVESALVEHPGKPIRMMLPPNCYGGTNDQARRIADLTPDCEIVDLLVDGGNDLVSSLKVALAQAASIDAVALALAEIPTNPRVEVPDIAALGEVLSELRHTPSGDVAVAPVFMVDQTFCPNVKLLQDDSEMAKAKLISYSSGSKFPSGGRCIAGYCAVNQAAKDMQPIIKKHLVLTDNAAIAHQMNTLAKQMPSMPERINKAYHNARMFVEHIEHLMPQAKINFVSDELAEQGFTPSVFSLDLPAKGNNSQEKESHKRELNQKLIDIMIGNHPDENKYCVSYGQLKGTYWTIPATSTQGTTKESDKDYIIRVALSPQSDIEGLCKTFSQYCANENLA